MTLTQFPYHSEVSKSGSSIELDYIVNRDKIEHGVTGYVLPYGYVSAMVRSLEMLLNNPQMLIDFGVAGRQRAMSIFSWQTVCELYRQLFLRIARPTKPRSP